MSTKERFSLPLLVGPLSGSTVVCDDWTEYSIGRLVHSKVSFIQCRYQIQSALFRGSTVGVLYSEVPLYIGTRYRVLYSEVPLQVPDIQSALFRGSTRYTECFIQGFHCRYQIYTVIYSEVPL